MAVNLSPLGGAGAQFFDNNGVILSGGKIYTYAAGTTTPQVTYTSASGATPHANPIILDSAGRVPGGEIWLTTGVNYKFVLETSTGVLLGTYDNIMGGSNAASIEYDPPFTGAVTSGYTVADKLAQCVSVKDFGAVAGPGANQTANLAAINAAIATGKAVYFPTGLWYYNATIKPAVDGQRIYSDGPSSGLIYTGTGFAFSFLDRNLCELSDIGILTADEGVDFDIASGNCNRNIMSRVFIFGPGRGATRATRNTDLIVGSTAKRGIRFGPMQSLRAVFFNTVRDCFASGFDRLISYENPTGTDQGGNAQSILNFHGEQYWTAHHIESIENNITGGFFNQASGNSPSDYTVAYRLLAGAQRNDILPAIGEPGLNTYCLIADAGSNTNRIGSLYGGNYDLGNIDNGSLNSMSIPAWTTSGMLENTYQAVQVVYGTTSGTSGNLVVRYNGRNAATGQQGNGYALINVVRGASTWTAECLVNQLSGSGSVPFLVGYEQDGSSLSLVFFIPDNGTSSTASMSISVESVSISVPQIDGEAVTTVSPGANSFPSALGTNFSGNIGFFGTLAVAKPTGVAVTAAGIHAALVTLGLIAP